MLLLLYSFLRERTCDDESTNGLEQGTKIEYHDHGILLTVFTFYNEINIKRIPKSNTKTFGNTGCSKCRNGGKSVGHCLGKYW